MYQLNEKIRELVPYQPIAGEYSIRLDANESFCMLPQEIEEKLLQACRQIAWNRYPDASCRELCQAFGDFYGVDPSLVTPGDGSDELLSILCNAFLMPGEVLMTAEPDFSMYRFYGSIAGAEIRCYPKPEGFAISVEDWIRQIQKEKARMVIFSNPCNPTGRGLSREDVRKLVRSVDALVVLDEAYMDFWDQSLLQEVCQYDNLIVLKTCSKALGMASLRLGFAVANPILTRALWAVKSPYNINSFTQAMGYVILREKQWAEKARKEILDARDGMVEALAEIEARFPEKLHCYPSCTNFVFMRVQESKRVFDNLLKKGIAVRHMGEYLRITVGTPAENKEFLQAFQDVL